jgi:hypothetical protein
MILSESGRHHFSKHFTRNHERSSTAAAARKMECEKKRELCSFLKVNETARKRKMSEMILLIASFRIVSFFIQRAAMKGENASVPQK